MTSLREHLAARRAVAERATGGRWESRTDVRGYCLKAEKPGRPGFYTILAHVFGGDDPASLGTHIAANDPTTITLMLDALDAAERRREAKQALDALKGELRLVDYPSTDMQIAATAFLDAIRDEDAALDRLHAHMEQEAGNGNR